MIELVFLPGSRAMACFTFPAVLALVVVVVFVAAVAVGG